MQIQNPGEKQSAAVALLESQRTMISEAMHASMKKNPGTFFAFALQAMQRPEIAACSPTSVLAALHKSATLGLPPDGRRAALIPRKNRRTNTVECHLDPMYQGLVELARRSNEVKQCWSEVVYQTEVDAGRFNYSMGAHPVLEHTPMRGKTRPDDSEIVFAYACARWANGHVDFFVCDRAEIESARRMSMTPDGAWKTHFPAQAKKTAVKRLAKLLPMPDEAAEFLREQEEQEVEALDVQGEMLSEKPIRTRDELVEALAPLEPQDAPGATQPPEDQAPRIIRGIPVDVDWDAVKDQPFGGQNKVIGPMTPAQVQTALMAEDPKVKAAADNLMKIAFDLYAGGQEPPKPYQILALAMERAELGGRF